MRLTPSITVPTSERRSPSCCRPTTVRMARCNDSISTGLISQRENPLLIACFTSHGSLCPLKTIAGTRGATFRMARMIVSDVSSRSEWSVMTKSKLKGSQQRGCARRRRRREDHVAEARQGHLDRPARIAIIVDDENVERL